MTAMSSLEIASVDIPAVIDPSTGEAVVIAEATTDTLAMFLDNVREVEQTFREEKRAVTREIVERMDREARWTGIVGDYKIVADGPTKPTEYQAEALYEALREYVDSGAISEDALDAAVERSYTYKAKHRGIQALAKLGGHIAETIAAHSHEVEKERRVKVSRA